MSLYVYDEDRWFNEDPDVYGDFLAAQHVTDVIIVIYGHWKGGTMGWHSDLIGLAVSGSVVLPPAEYLHVFIAKMADRGITVHGGFDACYWQASIDPNNGFVAKFPSWSGTSPILNVFDPLFPNFISDLTASALVEVPELVGISLDIIRTADWTRPQNANGDIPENDAKIEEIVRLCAEKCRAVNPNIVMSSTTGVYGDVIFTTQKKFGRKAVNWANAGYQDIIFDMNYLHPPTMDHVAESRTWMNDPSQQIVMVGNFVHPPENPSGQAPATAAAWQTVLDAMTNEEHMAIYHKITMTAEHAVLTTIARQETEMSWNTPLSGTVVSDIAVNLKGAGITLTPNASTVEGNLMVACLFGRQNADPTWQTLAGWNQVYEKIDESGLNKASAVYTKYAGAGEGSSTFKTDREQIGEGSGVILTFAGGDPTTPMDVTYDDALHFVAHFNMPTTNDDLSQPITTASDNAYVLTIMHVGFDDVTNASPTSTGYSLLASNIGAAANNVQFHIQGKVVTSAGVETPDAAAIVSSGSSSEVSHHTFALKAGAGAPPPPPPSGLGDLLDQYKSGIDVLYDDLRVDIDNL